MTMTDQQGNGWSIVAQFRVTRYLKKIPPEVKLANANSLLVMARDALYHQEIRRGRSPEEAMRIAAPRLLAGHAR